MRLTLVATAVALLTFGFPGGVGSAQILQPAQGVQSHDDVIGRLGETVARQNDRMLQQESEIKALRTEVEELRRALGALTAPAVIQARGDVRAAPESSPKSLGSQTVPSVAMASDVKDVAPLGVRIGAATFTPFGFVDLVGVLRSTNVGSGSGTAFGSIPFASSVQGRLPESRQSAQNSRFGLMIDTVAHGNQVLGFLEADFVGSQPIDGVVTRNSNPLNLRSYFVSLRRGRFELTAGQAWSLMTPGRRGVSPLPNDVFYTVNLDTNYQVGLTWSRIPQVRFAYRLTPHLATAVSLENPEQYVGTFVTFPVQLSQIYNVQLDTGNGTLSVPNLHPDVVSKIAYDTPLAGRNLHVELAGEMRDFHVVNPLSTNGTSAPGGVPIPPSLQNSNYLKRYGAFGGAVSLNGSMNLFGNFRMFIDTFASDGGGRLISGLFPDLIVRGDGSLSLVHAFSTLDGVEYAFSKNNLVYGYYGAAYGQRNLTQDPFQKNAVFGFGSHGNTNANRLVSEVTVGYDRTIWRNPFYGALQFNSQISYVKRSPWDVDPATFRSARLYMIYLGFRYLLP